MRRLPALKPAAPAPEDWLAAEAAALAAAHPVFAPLLAATGPLPLRPLESGFAGLAWVVLGQQISVGAQRAIHGRLAAALGPITAEAFAAADDAALRQAGLSAGKVATLRGVAAAIAAGTLDLDSLAELEAEEAIARLSAMKGIGRWTAEVYLLFALRHPDVFPAADLALQEAARIGLGLAARPGEKELRALAAPWQPRRAVAARLLWAYYRHAKGLRETAPV
jgi:DNA-3-methyladenine glycosylase II